MNVERFVLAVLLFALIPVATKVDALYAVIAVNILLWAMIAFETCTCTTSGDTSCATTWKSKFQEAASGNVSDRRRDSPTRTRTPPPLPLGGACRLRSGGRNGSPADQPRHG